MLMAVIASLSCKDAENRDFQGTLIIKLVDAPAALEQLNIVFRRVLIHRAGLSDDLGWRVVSDDVLTQDIIALRNGQSRNIVSAVVPEGSYDKVQVLFGISSLVQDGVEATILIPTEFNNGVTFEHSFEVREGTITGITFDFDATRSVKVAQQGNYELRPIVRIQNTDLAGSIVGAVLPDSVQAVISTATGTDSVTTLSLALAGNNSFELVDLPEGSYSVTISPTDAAYADTTLTSVTVIRKLKQNVGAVLLRPR